MKVTIKEIADMAGVHRATVDKVLHNRPGVSDELRQKIKRIIQDVGYTPNPAGRVLQKQSKIYHFAAIFCDVDATPFLTEGIRRGLDQHDSFNIEVSYHTTGFQDAAQQARLIDQAVRDGVDGIILSPINSGLIRRAINRAADQRIPVITADSDIENSKRMCFVGLDGARASRVAGRLMGQFLGGTGDLAIISSAIATENNNYFVTIREQEFYRFMTKNYPGVHITKRIESLEDPKITYEETRRLLAEQPHLKAIYITCGGVAEVGRALRESGRENEIRVLSYEDYPEILELIQEEVVDVTIASDLISQGEIPIRLLMNKLVFGKSPEQERIYTDIRILVKESL
ncbi:MAG: substrate-binding domain-containing protein [Oscillibacter sp.]|nr:substrate-binding domain-containing protein [Oscillibacter sp.]